MTDSLDGKAWTNNVPTRPLSTLLIPNQLIELGTRVARPGEVASCKQSIDVHSSRKSLYYDTFAMRIKKRPSQCVDWGRALVWERVIQGCLCMRGSAQIMVLAKRSWNLPQRQATHRSDRCPWLQGQRRRQAMTTLSESYTQVRMKIVRCAGITVLLGRV